MPTSRTSLAPDRSRSPLQANMVEFRPASWPKGGDYSRITLMKPPRSHRVILPVESSSIVQAPAGSSEDDRKYPIRKFESA